MKLVAHASDLEMATSYLESCYSIDASLRFTVGKGEQDLLPRFVLVRTRLGCLWRFRADLAAAAIRELAKLAGREGKVAAPFDTLPPPERVEPMVRALHRTGIEVEVARDLLVHRVGWEPSVEPASFVKFQSETFEANALENETGHVQHDLVSAAAQLASISWKQRRELVKLDVRQWICFADVTKFVDRSSEAELASTR